MKKLNIKTISLLMIGAGVLTGCAATQKATERFDTNKSIVEKELDKSLKGSATSIIGDQSNKMSNFGKTARNWIDPTPLPRVEEAQKLPDFFNKPVSITMPGTVNAPEILSELQRSTGIKFDIGLDIYDTTPGHGKIVNPTDTGGSGTSNKTAMLLIPDFVYRGTLEGALNLFSAKANVSWKWNGRSVEVYRYEVKTYNIAALAGETRTSSNVDLKGDTTAAVGDSDGGGTSPSGGTSSSNVVRNANLTTWDEVKAFLVSQLSSTGSIAILESAGAVTVRDLPQIHKKLEKSINDLNALLTKQIFLNVDIYSVNANDRDNAGIDWNLVWSTPNARNSYSYVSTVGETASAPNPFTVGIMRGPFAGTNVVMQQLSTVGKTSILNQFQVTTLNGQPTPIAANKKTGYMKEVSVTPGTDGQPPTYELVPGEISSGVNLNITPKVEPNGNILLEYSMNLSDLEDLRIFTAGDGSRIEIPTSNLKSVLQRATLRSGHTLVLSGFKQTSSLTSKSGVGSPSNMFLGGKHEAGTTDQYLVITVTPYIANNNSEFRN